MTRLIMQRPIKPDVPRTFSDDDIEEIRDSLAGWEQHCREKALLRCGIVQEAGYDMATAFTDGEQFALYWAADNLFNAWDALDKLLPIEKQRQVLEAIGNGANTRDTEETGIADSPEVQEGHATEHAGSLYPPVEVGTAETP